MTASAALLTWTAPRCILISRKGHVYRGFDPPSRALAQLARPVVLDGEIVSLDSEGRSRFYDLA